MTTKNVWCFACVLVLSFFVQAIYAQDVVPTTQPVVQAQGGDIPAELKPFDEMVNKALTAYNAEDFKAFYADYAKMMSGVATEQAFKSLYIDNYKTTFGKYVSRSFVKEQSSVPENAPVALIVYSGVFEKESKVKISMNFTKEENSWKLMQVQFAKE